MSKRLVDTTIWTKAWFRALDPEEKCAWKYLTDQCDNVGVWSVDTELADTFIGKRIDWKKFPEKCNNNIFVMSDTKWWLVDFCSFQHPDLDPNSKSKPILSYIRDLKRHGIWDEAEGCPYPFHTLCDMVQGKERLGKVRKGEGPFPRMPWQRNAG